jgi:hypothetical protein
VVDAWGKRVLAILGSIGTVSVALAWGFYPVGVIVLLSVAVIGALWVAWDSQQVPMDRALRGSDPHAQQHDARLVAEVRGLVTRNNVTWLRQWDFGGSWRDEWMRPFIELEHLDDVEHTPLDDDLAVALRRLFDANAAMMRVLTQNGFRERNASSDRWWNVGWSGGEADGLEGRQRRLWEQRRDELNAAADPVAIAYDEFIDVARRQLLLETEGDVAAADTPDQNV